MIEVKKESEKAGLKLNIQKMKTMISSPMTSWQIDGETKETVTDFIFSGPKITVDSNCSHKTIISLLFGMRAMKKLDRVLKSIDIIFLTKVHIIKVMVFPRVMYGCENWTEKTEHF